MNTLQDFFSKFKQILGTHQDLKKPFIEAVKKSSGITLAEQDINIKEGIAQVISTPSIKNELFMRKAAILKELSAQSFTIRDIR